MYGVVLTVSVVLAILYYNVLPAWLGVVAPGLLGLVVIYRAAYWIKARDLVDTLSPAQHAAEIRRVTLFGVVLSFSYTLIAMLVLGHGSSEQQILALVLIWAVISISAFCAHAVPMAAMGVVVSSTVPLSFAFLWSHNALVNRLMPVLLLMGGLVAYVLLELYRGFVRIVQVTAAAENTGEQALHAARHDPLTGLPNRLLLSARLDEALARLQGEGTTFAVHCIDLDRFKEVNEAFGHDAGDELLRRASAMFRACAHPADTLARLGGDEFVLIQNDADAREADLLARNLVDILSAPITISSGKVYVGCSVGTSLIRSAALRAEECMRQADMALYRAKESGRRRHVAFDEELDAVQRERQIIRDDLHTAIERGQIHVAYQPQVREGVMIGVEALVRWRHPERGVIPPSVFIPIAEESGLIEEIGHFVLHRALLDSRELAPLRVSINVSALQLRRPEFISLLRAQFAETGAEASRIDIEITESLLLGYDPDVRQILESLHALGCGVVLDDFGTGYSSLGYLQRYPIDKLKIDRVFIAQLGDSPGEQAVVAAIVAMSRALGVAVMAEGVETFAQRDRLLALGCSEFQGYLYGRAMPLEDLREVHRSATAHLQKETAGVL